MGTSPNKNLTSTVRLVIFDKDGTLLDYERTWDRTFADVLDWAANRDRFPERWRAAADAVGFDLDRRATRADSPLIAEPETVVIELLMPWVDPERIPDGQTLSDVTATTSAAYLTAIDGADELLAGLSQRGITAAIATNDTEAAARATVDQMGWSGLIDSVVGADSGFGAKPDPGMLTRILDSYGVDASDALMVGDTAHDMRAARAAGITGVLLAPAGAPRVHADIVISDLRQVLDLVEHETRM